MKKKHLIILSVALILVLAMSVLSSGFRDWNAQCWFGHNYVDGVCARCGEDKPVEDEPDLQALISEPYRMSASAKKLNASNIDTQADNIPQNVPDGYRPVRAGDVIIGSKDIWYYFYFENSGGSHYGFVETTKLLDFKNGKTLYGAININDEFFGIYPSEINQSYDESLPSDLNLYDWYDREDPATVNGFVPIRGDEFARHGLVGEVSAVSQNYALYINPSYVEVPPTAPAKTGYTFTGWYTDAACTNKYTEPYVTSDLTLYAGYKAHEYSIKFNANSASGTMANLAMTYDQSKNLTANGFTKEHYIFKGWATSLNGAVVYSDKQSVKNLTAADGAVIELFAVWELSEVAVTLVIDGQSTVNYIPIGTKVTLPETPNKEGYNFLGWYLPDGTEYTTQNLSEDTVLTARFEIIHCTITFVVDGEVYAIYVCDWGTKLSEALNATNVNSLLMRVEDEYRENF